MSTDSASSPPKVLIMTLPPFEGGVPALARIMVKSLQDRGCEVTLAYYAALTQDPTLSKSLVGKRPFAPSGTRDTTCFDGVKAVAVGTDWPEFEFSYYVPSERWTALMEAHDRHIAIGGTVLISYPLVKADRPHITWFASNMIEDRQDRRAAMGPLRQFVDRRFIGPIQQKMECEIGAGLGTLRPISAHTIRTFKETSGFDREAPVLPVPTDCDLFTPPQASAKEGVIGFAGRPNDPRKNIPLLLDAFKLLLEEGREVSLSLTNEPEEPLQKLIADKGLSDHVSFTGRLAFEALPDFYRSLDVFVIPSHQEGLGIVGIEAMACGVPVVSTRCGGPQDYVIDGETGLLTASTPHDMAQAIRAIIDDRAERERLSKGARDFAVKTYSQDAFETGFEAAWAEAFREPAPALMGQEARE